MLDFISISLFSNIFLSIAFLLSFSAIFCAKNDKNAENGTKKVLKPRKKVFSWMFDEEPLLPNEVHKPIHEAVAEGLILDPKNVKYVRNIDRKQNPLEKQLEIDLNRISDEKEVEEEEAPLFSTGRVRIRESKCKLYETCDVKTADENSLKTCRA